MTIGNKKFIHYGLKASDKHLLSKSEIFLLRYIQDGEMYVFDDIMGDFRKEVGIKQELVYPTFNVDWLQNKSKKVFNQILKDAFYEEILK